jgi:PilZ domain
VTTPPEHHDRRRAPRVDLLTEFQGHVIALDEVVRIQQLGPAGMTIAGETPLSPAHVHDIQLTLDDKPIILKARVVHTRMTVDRGDEFTYISGLSFVDPPAEAVDAINAFLSRGAAGTDEESSR